jgi:hypothetical protein
VRAIAAACIKTDRIDATILAHLARTDLLPAAYAPPVEVRELREVVRHRPGDRAAGSRAARAVMPSTVPVARFAGLPLNYGLDAKPIAESVE